MRNLLREMIREMITDPDYRTIGVEGYPLQVEIASTPEQHAQGLMHRDSLDPDCGMLFCYDGMQDLSFWMRDTHIPLSIAFIDDECRISSIHDMDPHDENHITSSRPCRWALETNRGWFGSRNVRVGAKISGLDV